jgi:site-specific DNA recombinase
MAYEVVAERKEIASGSMVMSRSDLQSLFIMGGRGELDVIVVDIPDRLGRGDTIAQCELLAKLNQCRIEYAQPGQDVDTVEGYIQHAAAQMVSGIERHNIKRRTSGGKVAWAQKGRVIAPPRRPYGYEIVKVYDDRGRKTDCTFSVREEEAEIVRRIYAWYAVDGLSIDKIAGKLTTSGVPRMSDYDEDHKAIREKKATGLTAWPRATVGNILRNPMYKGEWQYGRRTNKRHDTPDGVRTETHLKQLGEAVVVPVPAIVSPEQWEIVQFRLVENRKKFMRPTNLPYALRGRLRCALCGSKYYCVSDREDRFYKCYRSGYDYRHDPIRCPAGSTAAYRLEEAVWACVCEQMQDIDTLKEGIQERNAQSTETRRVLEQSLAALQSQVDSQDGAIDRYLTLYGKGLITEEKYTQKKAEVDAETLRLVAEREKIEAQLAGLPTLNEDQFLALLKLQGDLADRLHPGVPIENQVQLYDILDVSVKYNAQTDEGVVSGLFGNVLLTTSSRLCGQHFGFAAAFRLHPQGFELLGGGLYGPGQHEVDGVGELLTLNRGH